MFRNVGIILLVVASPCTLSADEFEASWMAEGETSINFGDMDFVNALTKTGDLGGILKDAQIMSSAESTAKASYTSKGSGYSLGIEAQLEASGFVEIGDTFYGSSSDIHVTGEYQDRIELVGEGDLPFGSVNINWLLEGSFSSTIADPDSDQARASVNITDKETGASFQTEYARGFGEEEGSGNVMVALPLQKVLGLDGDATLKAEFDVRGFVNSGATLGINFMNTLALDSITFPDGSTPESHGFSILFNSGLTSPNLNLELQSADFDLNGRVEGGDLLRWQRGVGIASDALPTDGDADGNNQVDSADLMQWEAQFGSSVLPVGPSSNVPEPEAAALALVATLCFAIGFLDRISRRWFAI